MKPHDFVMHVQQVRGLVYRRVAVDRVLLVKRVAQGAAASVSK